MIAFTSSTVVSRAAMNDRSTIDTLIVGTRIAIAVELAVQLGQHEADRRGGAGLGRDHAHRGGARAAQVLVVDVGQHLVVRVRVDGRHQPVDDADLRRAAA